jgi:hypothetical protein
VGIRCADHATPSIHESWHYFANNWRSLGRHSSLAGPKPRSQATDNAIKQTAVNIINQNSRGGSVGIAAGQRPDGSGSIPGRDKKFSLLHSVQTGSGAHLASHPVGTGGSLPWGKAAGAWNWSLTSY